METSVAAHTADAALPGELSLVRVIDKWIYVFMAGFFIAITLVGFIPDSLTKIAAVEAGQRPPFPIALHVHAVLMGGFLLLLMTQTILMATGRRQYHMQLGVAGAAMAAALWVAGIVLVPTMYHQVWNAMQVVPPDVQAELQQGLRAFDNIMLMQISIGLLFPVFVVTALRARKQDSELHKRMMFIAVAIALPAAFDRMLWLPTSMPGSPLAPFLYTVLALSPMIVWDVYRKRALPRAYVIWLALWLPVAIVTYSVWDAEWWHQTAPRIVGI